MPEYSWLLELFKVRWIVMVDPAGWFRALRPDHQCFARSASSSGCGSSSGRAPGWRGRRAQGKTLGRPRQTISDGDIAGTIGLSTRKAAALSVAADRSAS